MILGRVLLVEDEELVRRFLAGLLDRNGWAVTVAVSGTDALAQLASTHFDVILCDFDLGRGPNGLDVLSHRPALNVTTPLVILTGHGTVSRCRDALRNGATDFIEKPSSPAEILEAVRRAVGEAETRNPLLVDGGEQALPTNCHRHVKLALAIIERRFRDPGLSIDDVARGCGITRQHLARLFDAHLGRRPLEHLQTVRIAAAKILLQDGRMSIAEIAFDCGYRSPRDLTLWFQRLCDRTPTEWRTTTQPRNRSPGYSKSARDVPKR